MYGRRGLSSAIGIPPLPTPSRLILPASISFPRARSLAPISHSFSTLKAGVGLTPGKSNIVAAGYPGNLVTPACWLAFYLHRACIQGASGVTHCLSM